jgi:parallel beta-helix repeat protein
MALPSRLLATALAAASVAAALPAPAAADVHCDAVAAADGSDAAAGTASAPFATPARLARSLQPGQTGCVRGSVNGSMWVSSGGVTITSEPGQRGRVVGQIVIDSAAHRVTVADLDVDGTGLVRPTTIVLGDDAVIRGIDLTTNNTQGICMILGTKGHDGNHVAERTTIESSRIHDCGVVNNHQHGIYVEHAVDTRIVGNEIFDNADRGIQLYPDAQNTLIAGNVIDGNGEGIAISGFEGSASSGTRVRGNLITNARIRAGVESWFPGPEGQDNLVEQNCFHGGKAIDEGGGGFVARENVFQDPGYADRSRDDFRVDATTRCGALLAWGRGGLAGDAPALAQPPAPVTPAAAGPDEDPGEAAPLSIGLRRGPISRLTRTIIVRVRALENVPLRTYARVEVRYQGRGWRVAGLRRVAAGRPSAVRVRIPRRARGLAVRATLLKASGNEVVTFRARGRR